MLLLLGRPSRPALLRVLVMAPSSGTLWLGACCLGLLVAWRGRHVAVTAGAITAGDWTACLIKERHVNGSCCSTRPVPTHAALCQNSEG